MWLEFKNKSLSLGFLAIDCDTVLRSGQRNTIPNLDVPRKYSGPPFVQMSATCLTGHVYNILQVTHL